MSEPCLGDKDAQSAAIEEGTDFMSRKTTVDYNNMELSKPFAVTTDQSHRLQCQTSFVLGNEQIMSSVDRDDEFFIDEFLSNPIQVRN